MTCRGRSAAQDHKAHSKYWEMRMRSLAPLKESDCKYLNLINCNVHRHLGSKRCRNVISIQLLVDLNVAQQGRPLEPVVLTLSHRGGQQSPAAHLIPHPRRTCVSFLCALPAVFLSFFLLHIQFFFHTSVTWLTTALSQHFLRTCQFWWQTLVASFSRHFPERSPGVWSWPASCRPSVKIKWHAGRTALEGWINTRHRTDDVPWWWFDLFPGNRAFIFVADVW